MIRLIRVYLDSNILLAKITGFESNRTQTKLADQVFDKIKEGHIEGVVSALVLIEIMAVLKNRVGQDKSKLLAIPDVTNRVDHVIKESSSMYKKILEELLRMENKIIFQVKKSIDMNQLLTDAQLILDSVRGTIKTHDYCKKCNKGRIPTTSYKSLASYDALHVLLAKEMECDEFWTFDGDFEEIRNHQKVTPLQIKNIRTADF